MERDSVPHLRYTDNEGMLQSIPLNQQELTIGRAPQCELVLEDDLASREHARIVPLGEKRWQVEDLESRNRTYVNNQAIKSRILVPGDVIRIGSRHLEYVDDAAAQKTLAGDIFLADRQPPPGHAWRKLNQVLELTADQFQTLALAVDAIPRIDDLGAMAEALLTQAVRHLGADRGFVAVRGKDAKSLELIASRAFLSPESGRTFVPVSQMFVQACQKQNACGYYPSGDAEEKVGDEYSPTAVIAPLRDGKRIQGAIYLDRDSARHRYREEDARWLGAAACQFAGLWGDMQQRVLRLQQRETALRLSTLRRLHRGINTMEGDPAAPLRVACRQLAGRERSGELYHVVSLDEKRLAVLVADAGGVGTAGVVQGASVLAALRAQLTTEREELDLGAIFDAANRVIASRPNRQPVAAAGLHIDIGTGKLTYINAGYPAPTLLTGPGRLVTLDHPSLLLGVDPQGIYQQAVVDVPARFRLLVFSDGLVDAWNKTGECFSAERVRSSLLDEEAFTEPAKLIDLVAGALAEFRSDVPLHDDALLIAVARD